MQKTGISFRPPNGGTYSFYYELDRGEISVDEYFQALLNETKSNQPMQALKEAYRQAYLETSRLNTELLEKLKQMRGKYRLVCASTTNRFHEEINRERGLMDYFDKTYFSHDLQLLGYAFLAEILALEDAKPLEVLMVDNDKEQWAYGLNMGMDAILFKNNAQLIDEFKKRNISWE